jgi:RNA polymerase sigma-70 factor (ECF subfamily)
MDDAEFSALAAPHILAMLQTAASLVGAADAEDAAQEALLRAWRGSATLRDVMVMRAWLLRITVNVCLDWQRGRFGTRARRTARFSSEEHTGVGAGAALDAATPGARTTTADAGSVAHVRTLDVRGAIDRLEEGLRLIVVLRYYAGMDSTEVSSALGIPASTVRTRLQHALQVLRDELSEVPESNRVITTNREESDG